MFLFHRDIGFPKNISLQQGIFKLIWTNHAKEASMSDKHGEITKVNGICISPSRIFEVELCERGNIIKFCYRSHHCAKYDISYAFTVEKNYLVVKTVWLNKKTDNHKTLKSKRYCYVD